MSKQKNVKARLREIRALPGNDRCADCDVGRPTWASFGKGEHRFVCLVCDKCSGAHRHMGTHITFVQSTTIDERFWVKDNYAKLKELNAHGNNKCNKEYAHKIPERVQINENTDGYARERFVHDKYEHKTWFKAAAKRKKSKKPKRRSSQHKSVAAAAAKLRQKKSRRVRRRKRLDSGASSDENSEHSSEDSASSDSGDESDSEYSESSDGDADSSATDSDRNFRSKRNARSSQKKRTGESKHRLKTVSASSAIGRGRRDKDRRRRPSATAKDPPPRSKVKKSTTKKAKS